MRFHVRNVVKVPANSISQRARFCHTQNQNRMESASSSSPLADPISIHSRAILDSPKANKSLTSAHALHKQQEHETKRKSHEDVRSGGAFPIESRLEGCNVSTTADEHENRQRDRSRRLVNIPAIRLFLFSALHSIILLRFAFHLTLRARSLQSQTKRRAARNRCSMSWSVRARVDVRRLRKY